MGRCIWAFDRTMRDNQQRRASPRRGRSSSLLRAVLLKKAPSGLRGGVGSGGEALGLVACNLIKMLRLCGTAGWWRSLALLWLHLPASHRDGDLADKSGTSTSFVGLWPEWLVSMMLFARTSPRCMVCTSCLIWLCFCSLLWQYQWYLAVRTLWSDPRQLGRYQRHHCPRH
jgi:hypothetical protein